MKPTAPVRSAPQFMDIQEALNLPQASRASRLPPRRRAAPVLVTAFIGVMVGFGSLFISTFGGFLKPVAADMGWSRTQMSSAFTVAVLSVALTAPLVGRLLDRVQPRRIVIPCTVVWGLGFASLSMLTRNLGHLLGVYAIMGIAGIATTQLGYAKVVSTWFDRARGRALATVMAGSGIGFMVFPPLAQSLISHLGWRVAYALLGALVLSTAVPLAALFLHGPDGASEAAATEQTRKSGAGALMRTFPFLGIICSLLLFLFATNGLNTHWAALLNDRGLSPASSARVLSVAGLATLISKLTTGYLLDGMRANRAGAILFLSTAAGLITIASRTSLGSAYGGAVLVGIGMGAEADVVPYLLTRYFGLQHFSELYSYTWTVYAMAGGLGPLLAGSVYDRTGAYSAAILGFAALVLVASALLLSIPTLRSSSV